MNSSVRRSSSSSLSERISISMPADADIVFTDVPPSMTPTLNVVLGSSGALKSDIFAIALPIACIGLGSPKSAKLCPPLPVNVTL